MAKCKKDFCKGQFLLFLFYFQEIILFWFPLRQTENPTADLLVIYVGIAYIFLNKLFVRDITWRFEETYYISLYVNDELISKLKE